jgi:L-arabinose isomerase
MSATWRPRIGLVSVRFGLFDPQMPPDFPARMQERARRYAAALGEECDVVYPGLIEDETGARAAARALARERLDAVVFAPTMAAPPSYAAVVLRACPVPAVIWNPAETPRLPADWTQPQATEHTAAVGCVMLANVLVRSGRPASVVTAPPDDAAGMERLRRTVRGAAAAGSFRDAVALRVGDPIAGYLDVEASVGDLAGLGVRERRVSVRELDEAFAAATADDAHALLDRLRGRGWSGGGGPQAEASARLALALEGLMDVSGAAFGTVNCHGPFFRSNPAIGLAACLGVSMLADAGRPLSCTGDQPTAVSLALARRLAGAALYCECYAAELDSGLMLLAAGGEGDPAWAEPPDRVALAPNDHYPGCCGAGTCVSFALRRGPATLLSLSPGPAGWRLAWATGQVVESRHDRLGGPSGMFRFDAGPSRYAGERWIASGATHHNALAPGRLDLEVVAAAQALRVEAVRV